MGIKNDYIKTHKSGHIPEIWYFWGWRVEIYIEEWILNKIV